MIEKKKNENVTLSDKIAGILNSVPTSYDVEDDAADDSRAKIVEEGIGSNSDEDKEEELLSKFRRYNIDLLADVDEKYAGKKTSREKLRDSDSEDIPSDDDSESGNENLSADSDNDDIQEKAVEEDEQDSSDASMDDGEEATDDDESGDDQESDNLESFQDEDLEKPDPNFKHISDTNVSKQVKKGTSVRNQMAMWENLLEIRIQLQKCLLTANKMPQNHTFKEIKKESGQEFLNNVNETKNKLCDTLDKLLLLQKLLIKQFPETRNLGKKSSTSRSVAVEDDEIPSDTDNERSTSEGEDESEAPQKKKRKLEDYEKDISDQHKVYKEYRNSVIKKWNDKTRVILKGGATSHTVLDQIEYNLTNKDRLIKRTQLKRSSYVILGEEEKSGDKEEEYNTEIFDDDDFYHQLLRELIEVKSADVTDPVQLGRQWIQLQNLRSKMKRKIDTRATKGRKIRYVVHNKLVNFMAPIDENLWTDEAKNELYSSLFGKNQPILG